MSGMSLGGSLWSSDMISMVASSSQLDELLDRGEYTLQQILEQDDVIQECKAMNSILVDFLCKPESVVGMVKYITVTPEEKDDAIRKEKFPFVSAELFACELVSMLDALLENADAMEILFNFVKAEGPLNPTLAGYFRKVVGVLIQRKYEELSYYIEQHAEVLTHLINHIDSTSIMEVLIMLGWDDGYYQHSNDVQWLIQLKFIPQIVGKLSKEFSDDIHTNAAYTLVDVITKSPPSQPSPLMQHVQSPPVLASLLGHVFSGSTCSFVHGVRVIIALLQRCVQFETEFMEADATWDMSPIMDAIIERLEDLLKMLNTVPTEELKTSYGALKPPLGEVRLRAAELTCNLVQFDDPTLQAQMAKLRLLPRLLDLFFEYPWHNILHNLVESAIQIILAADEEKVYQFRKSLVHDGKLIDRIMAAPGISREESKSNGGFRLGYMAFVSRISLILAERQDKDNEIKELIGENPAWAAFVAGPLKEEQMRMTMVIGGGGRTMVSVDEADIYELSGVPPPTGDSGETGDSTGFEFGVSNVETFHMEDGTVLEYDNEDDEVFESDKPGSGVWSVKPGDEDGEGEVLSPEIATGEPEEE